MGSHLEVLWAHFSVHTSNFNWFLKIFSLMKSGSTLLGWDDSSTNVMRTLFSKLQLGSLDINLSMTWVYSGTPPYGHLGNTVTSLLQVYVDC